MVVPAVFPKVPGIVSTIRQHLSNWMLVRVAREDFDTMDMLKALCSLQNTITLVHCRVQGF